MPRATVQAHIYVQYRGECTGPRYGRMNSPQYTNRAEQRLCRKYQVSPPLLVLPVNTSHCPRRPAQAPARAAVSVVQLWCPYAQGEESGISVWPVHSNRFWTCRFHPRHRHGRCPPRLSLLAVCRCTHRQSGSPRAFQCCCSRHHPTPGHSRGVRWTREARGVKPRAFIVLRGRSCSPARRGAAAVRELADDRGDIQAMRAWGSGRREGVN